MDPKNKALTPELKQIYDRVMNTQVNPNQGANPPTQSAPSTPVAPPAQGAQGTPNMQPTAPNAQTPTMPSTPPPAATPPQMGSIGTPPPAPVTNPPTQPTSVLSSAQPRQVPNSGSFVFNGNKVITPQGGKSAAGAQKGSIPKAVIIALVVIVIAAWGGLWAKIFGLF
ncbi:MAG TPA: hypothetical protein VG965_01765 [Patescibacteria group bacterium]|nr:hypothetical protein [Patescibacteria group bacterium]